MVDHALPDVKPYPFDIPVMHNESDSSGGIRRLKVYPFSHRVVVLGRASKIDLEIFTRRVLDDQVSVYRRRGGGCAVLLDEGNLIIDLELRLPERKKIIAISRCHRFFNAWVLRAFHQLDIENVGIRGACDITIGERKVGGACLALKGNRINYSASLLVNADLEPIRYYLKHPPREPSYRSGRSHAAFLTTLHREFGVTMGDIEVPLQQALLTVAPDPGDFGW